MKKGKTNRINGLKHIKALYGTVDSKNLKSIYLNIQTWVIPKIDAEQNWNRIISNFSRQIRHTIYEFINRFYFEDKFIVDLDLRSSGIQYGKKSFLNLEITFFVKENINFKSTVLKNEMKKITSNIFSENFKNNDFFDFNISKKTIHNIEDF
jgi:hypothetical protein